MIVVARKHLRTVAKAAPQDSSPRPGIARLRNSAGGAAMKALDLDVHSRPFSRASLFQGTVRSMLEAIQRPSQWADFYMRYLNSYSHTGAGGLRLQHPRS